MAQHTPIHSLKQKGFQKVENSIRKKFANGIWSVTGSLKFEEILHKEFKVTSHDRVFVTHRVVNNYREMFEIHYDTKEEKILEIFFVS